MPVSAERLVKVAEGADDSTIYYIDVDTIKIFDGIVHSWGIAYFDKPQILGYSYIKTSMFYNCEKNISAIGTQIFFNAKNEIHSEYPKRESSLDYSKNAPGSIGDALGKFVCKRSYAKINHQDEESVNKSKTSSGPITGSGFRIARSSIVTNHHVVDGCSRLSVNGVAAQVRSSDARSDLALLNAVLAGPSTSLRAQRLAVGEPVSVAGYPLRGLLSGFNMTTGNLSSLSGMGGDTRLVQITAPVQPGNSGGPVLDSSGNLMAVVVSKLDAVKAAKLTGDIPQNVNFAINGNVLRSFLDANSVNYETANSDKVLATTAIAERAKGFTVLIECWR